MASKRTPLKANYSESDYEDRSPNPDYPSPDNFVFYPESPEGLRSNDNSPRKCSNQKYSNP